MFRAIVFTVLVCCTFIASHASVPFFHEPVDYRIGEYIEYICVSDMTGDRFVDVVAIHEDSVTLLLNDIPSLTESNRDIFKRGKSYHIQHASCVTTADFDGNGTNDLAIALDDVMGGPDNVSVMLNNGDGTFGSISNYSGKGKRTRSVKSADFDGDGNVDLALLHLGSERISILFNKGDGTFGNLHQYQIWEKPSEEAIAMAGEDYLRYAGIDPDAPPLLKSMAVGDFDNDTDSDLAIAYSAYYIHVDGTLLNCGRTTSIAILQNQGNRRFEKISDCRLKGQVESIRSADLNSDEISDLLATFAASDSVSIILSNGNGTFVNANSVWAGAFGTHTAVPVKFDSAGSTDLILGNNYGLPYSISIMNNDGKGNFAFRPVQFPDSVKHQTTLISATDFDNDNGPDILIGNIPRSGHVSFFFYRNLDKEFTSADDQLTIGRMYLNGDGVPENPLAAVQWFGKSAEQQNPTAQWDLSLCFHDGYGVKRCDSTAAYWARRSAELGNADGQNTFGQYLHKGIGIARNDSAAFNWFLRAAEQGHNLAQNSLANLYVIGEGIQKDHAKAIEWYRKAAEQGNVDAQFNMGVAYSNGWGVSEDEAIKWLKLAAEQGDREAAAKLSKVLAKATPASQINSFDAAMRKYEPRDDMIGLLQANDGIYSSYFEIVQKLAEGEYLVKMPSTQYVFHCTIPSTSKMKGFVTGTTFRAIIEAKGEYDYVNLPRNSGHLEKIELDSIRRYVYVEEASSV